MPAIHQGSDRPGTVAENLQTAETPSRRRADSGGLSDTVDTVEMVDMPLPPARPKRWMPRRKAEVVDAVRRGFLSLGDACERYSLSMEEYLAWQRDVELFGLDGLRVSKPRRRETAVTCPALPWPNGRRDDSTAQLPAEGR